MMVSDSKKSGCQLAPKLAQLVASIDSATVDRSLFFFTTVISHIESMQDITNNVVNITKNANDYSSTKLL
jgi:hypothetical protein